MEQINVREYIINNFKNDTNEELKSSIEESIKAKDDDTLIGLGVLFELLWNNTSNEDKDKIIINIKKGM